MNANEWGGVIASVSSEVENDWLVELFDSAKGAPKDLSSNGNLFYIGAGRTMYGLTDVNATGPQSWRWDDFSMWHYEHWQSPQKVYPNGYIDGSIM